MATVSTYGANYTIADNPTPSTVLIAGKWKGKVRHVSDKVTFVTAGSAASLIYVGKLPIGAIPLYTLFTAVDGTSTATGIVGYTGDTNALGTVAAVASNLEQLVYPTVQNTPLTAAKDVYITTATADTVADAVWNVTIVYSTPD